MLAQRGRIALRPSADSGLKYLSAQLTELPISSGIAAAAVSVALPHRDPFDRDITATATVHGLTLVTKNQKIKVGSNARGVVECNIMSIVPKHLHPELPALAWNRIVPVLRVSAPRQSRTVATAVASRALLDFRLTIQ